MFFFFIGRQTRRTTRKGPYERTNKNLKTVKRKSAIKPIRADVDKIMAQKSMVFTYVPTIIGPGKISIGNQIYCYHFKSLGINFWRCDNDPSCMAKVITKANNAWILDGSHNHELI